MRAALTALFLSVMAGWCVQPAITISRNPIARNFIVSMPRQTNEVWVFDYCETLRDATNMQSANWKQMSNFSTDGKTIYCESAGGFEKYFRARKVSP